MAWRETTVSPKRTRATYLLATAIASTPFMRKALPPTLANRSIDP